MSTFLNFYRVCFDTLEGHQSTVWAICFDNTGDFLVSCSDDKTCKIWKSYLPNNQEGRQTVLQFRPEIC